MSRRWIIIGKLRSETTLLGWGLRGRGWWLNWRGRCDWCQPCEFESVADVEWAVRRRLELAGLELLALASRPPRREYQELWAMVERKRKAESGKRKQ